MADAAQTAPAAAEPAAPAAAPEAPKTVSNEELERRVIEIVRTGDLQTLSTKRIRLQLEAELGLDLTDRKQDIDAMVLRALEAATAAAASESTVAAPAAAAAAVAAEAPANGDDDDNVDEPVDLDDGYGRNGRRRAGKKDAAGASPASSSEPESDEALARRLQMEEMRPRRAAAVASSRKSKLAESKPFKKSSSSAAGKERSSPKRPGAGISAEMVLSPALAELMGQTEVVKRLWEYIKEHNLQDPTDKRSIICDDKLRAVFNRDRVDMFKMNKILSTHVKARDDIVG